MRSFHGWGTNWVITWGVRCSVCFTLKLVKKERGDHTCSCSALVLPSELRYLSRHIKECQNCIYCLNFLKKWERFVRHMCVFRYKYVYRYTSSKMWCYILQAPPTTVDGHSYSCSCSCGSVVEHCVNSAKGCGFNSQGTHILNKMYNLNVSHFG